MFPKTFLIGFDRQNRERSTARDYDSDERPEDEEDEFDDLDGFIVRDDDVELDDDDDYSINESMLEEPEDEEERSYIVIIRLICLTNRNCISFFSL